MITLKKVLSIYDKKTKIKIFILICGIIAGALMEMIALAIISPFISLILDYSIVYENNILASVYNTIGFDSINSFLGFLASMIAFVYIFKGVYTFVLNRVKFRFISNQQVKLSNKMLKIVLEKPYLFHVSKNVAELQRSVVADVSQFMQLFTTVLALSTDLFMSFFILLFLFTSSIPMTIGVLGLSLLCMAIYFKGFRKKLRNAGNENRAANIKMIKTVNQSIGGIKDIKVLQRENYFLKEYRQKSNSYAATNRRFLLYNTIPKLMIESVCFGGAFIMISIIAFSGSNMEELVPQLSIFVLAAFRLLPAIARFAGYVNGIIFNKPSVDSVYNNLNMVEEGNKATERLTKPETSRDIRVDKVSFQYPKAKDKVLEDISILIPYKSSVALIGPTGSGKTTLADIILGIYEPKNGYVIYNGKSVHHNLEEWKKNIGYIPQNIYLLDDTIESNIAFGIPKDEIDNERIIDVIKKAQLTDFVESLPEKLDTIVGDRGVRLSGGQKQRIGIARALYNDPEILVLDEATSSLDDDTEKSVMEAIQEFKGEKTLIIIAHRLSTIENCDIVFKVENKKVIKQGENFVS